MAGKTAAKKAEKARIHIIGMTCTTCAATIKKGLAETPGVEQAEVDFAYGPEESKILKYYNL